MKADAMKIPVFDRRNGANKQVGWITEQVVKPDGVYGTMVIDVVCPGFMVGTFRDVKLSALPFNAFAGEPADVPVVVEAKSD